MPPVALPERVLPENSSTSESIPSSSQGSSRDSRFSKLRGVQWRIDLGILPSSSSSSIGDLRRVVADYRRRYAALRRQLLVDPPKDGDRVPDLVIDNPLSQNPDSTWSRFFRNAELEKMVDQDLSRLYPEHGSYFQTAACQAMLRRILLLWGLGHPEYGYRQGMHELMAPLLYVLHVDVQHLSHVRELYEDQFCDKYDGMSFLENNLACHTSSPVSLKWAIENNGETSLQGQMDKVRSLDELDHEVGTIVLLSDAYGAEGELGILLSERFLEHDAYCMFDALMSGAGGAVAMADYFSPSPGMGSLTGLPPVIEASSALYHVLSLVDSSLHSHLIELRVEPQYFALRWLRVLFGREFLLEDLLVIWDEIFASPNGISFSRPQDDMESNFRVLSSPRGAYIAAIAVSMLLHLRSSLLATENATSCLQRLLNFPENVDIKRLIEKAKSLQVLAFDSSNSTSLSQGELGRSKSATVGGYSISSGSVSPQTPLNSLPDTYWEEKWRVLHKVEGQQGSASISVSSGKKGSLDKENFALSRTESDPYPTKIVTGKKSSRFFVKRRLLEDLSRELGLEEDLDKSDSNEVLSSKVDVDAEKSFFEVQTEQDGIEKDFTCMTEETCLGRHIASEENSSVFSSSASPNSRVHDHENDSEKSSVISNLSIDDNDEEVNNMEERWCSTTCDSPPLPDSDPAEATTSKTESIITDATSKQATALKERKLLGGKFQWFWKFGRSTGEGVSERESPTEAQRTPNIASSLNAVSTSSTPDACSVSSVSSCLADSADKSMMDTLRNLGQSMLENIQVLELVFQQERGQGGSLDNLSRNILNGKGQATAMAALKELRKISNLLSEM